MKVLRRWVVLWLVLVLGPGAGTSPCLLAAELPAAAPEATARCRDGSSSFSRHRSGTCSHHGAVAEWLSAEPSATAELATSDTPPPRPQAPSPSCGVHCGTERWAVKTLSDPDRGRVRLTPVTTTIEALVALPRPAVLPAAGRADSVELRVYQVEARLMWLFTETDSDYHLVLASPRDTTVTMIAEVPDPHCAGACASGFSAVYAQVRRQLLDHLNSPLSVARPLVRVTGVGFFDFRHGQRGLAANAIELHPVIAVEFP